MIDFSVVLAPILQLWWLLAIVVIVLFFRSPKGKGIIGEGLLNFLINITLDKKKYQLLKNITLQADGGTTQIDHIVVSQYGVFIIETKNYKGWIFGNEHSKTWTQSIYGKKNTFQNPLHQNYKHVKVLQKLLNLSDEKLFSVVVFVGESTFKTDMPNNVLYPLGLLKYIKSHQTVLFTPREMWRAVEQIEDAQLDKGFKTDREHVQNLKKRTNTTSKKQTYSGKYKKDLLCPRCGKKLLIRTAKRGANIGNEFYGCSGYPKCKFTKSKI